MTVKEIFIKATLNLENRLFPCVSELTNTFWNHGEFNIYTEIFSYIKKHFLFLSTDDAPVRMCTNEVPPKVNIVLLFCLSIVSNNNFRVRFLLEIYQEDFCLDIVVDKLVKINLQN